MGFPVPETLLVGSSDELLLAFAQWEKLIFKPVYSRFASRTLIGPTIKEALNAVTFNSTAQWIAQELVEGSLICTYSVAQRGRLTAHIAYRSNFTSGKGAKIGFQQLTHEATFDWVRRFVAAVGFTGQIAFDFIETDQGEVMALECNPRATSGVHLLASYPDFVNAFLDDSMPCFSPCGEDSAMLSTGMLVYALKPAINENEIGRWLSAFFSSRDVIFDVLDPLPFLLQWRSFLLYRKVGKIKGLSPLAASTFDIEWNGEQMNLQVD